MKTERKQHTFADVKERIDSIVKTIALDESTLSVSFVSWDVCDKHGDLFDRVSGAVVGTAIGAVVGGGMGTSIGIRLFSGSFSNASYSGVLGVLVVTPTSIMLGCITAPFMAKDAKINPDHLELLQAHCQSNTLSLKTFAISRTQVSTTDLAMTIKSESKYSSFKKSELYVNDTIYPMPSLPEICKLVNERGALPTPSEFVTKLLAGQNPIPDGQSDEAVTDDRYMTALFYNIITHSQRDALVEKLNILATPLKVSFEQRLRANAETYQSTLVKLVVWVLLTICSVAGLPRLLFADNILFIPLLFGMIITLISSIVSLVRLNRSKWCCTIMKG